MTETETDTTDDAKKRAAYSKATTRLRNENRQTFDALLGEEYSKVGLTYTPRPSEEEKAKAEVQRLLAAYPALAAEVPGLA